MLAPVHELAEFHNRREVFRDRIHAGEVLGKMLAPKYTRSPDTLVLAIPSGGIPVGLELSSILELPLEVAIVRKIPIPGNTEAGFGAVTIEGNVTYDAEILRQLHLRPGEMERMIEQVRKELEERNRTFRSGRPFPDLAGQRVILVDDGLAAGYTMTAAMGMVRAKSAASAVVAAPTAPARTIENLRRSADEIYCPNIREGAYFAVADAYEEWYDLTRAEVAGMLEDRGLLQPAGKE